MKKSSSGTSFRNASKGSRAQPKAFTAAAQVAMSGATNQQRASRDAVATGWRTPSPAAVRTSATRRSSSPAMINNSSLPGGRFTSKASIEQSPTGAETLKQHMSAQRPALGKLSREDMQFDERESDTRSFTTPEPVEKAQRAEKHDAIQSSIVVRILSLAGEPLCCENLPRNCHQQAVHSVLTEILQKSKLINCIKARKCKFVHDSQVLGPRDITTVEELAASAGRADATSDSVTLELTLTHMTKPEKPELEPEAQMTVDEALLTAIWELDEARVDELLTAGANAQIEHPMPHESHQYMLPIHLAVRQTFRPGEPTRADGRAVILALLDDGADPAEVHRTDFGLDDDELSTAFEMALPQVLYDTKLLCAFLENGANPNTISNRRDADMYEHVLHMAVALQQEESAQALLEAGVHIDCIRDEVAKPVMGDRAPGARLCGWEHIVPEMLTIHERYAREQLRERAHGRRRRRAAAVASHPILAEKATMTALHVACAAGDLRMSAWLLARGANPNAVIYTRVASKSGSKIVEETPLQCALENGPGATPLVALLVISGADIKHCAGAEGKSPEALCNGSASMLGALRAEWSNPSVQALFPQDILPNVRAAIRYSETRHANMSQVE